MAINTNATMKNQAVPMTEQENTDIAHVVSLEKASEQSGLPIVAEAEKMAVATLQDCKRQYEMEIRESGLIDQLTSEIVLSDPNTIVNFGRESAEQLSKCADTIITTYDSSYLSKTSDMMKSLTNIMKKFDKEEIKKIEKEPGAFERLFNRSIEKMDKIVNKYNGVTTDIEKICTQLKVYEREIQVSNRDINRLYQANIDYYKTLVGYILAAEDGLKQVDDYRKQLENTFLENGDPASQLEIKSVDDARQLLEQRILDLKSAETVALQSLPLLKSKEYNNLALSRKIQSAFIITLPIFKNAISQALLSKQQRVQAQALEALDDTTNELWKKNVQSSVENMQLATKLGSTSAIKIETLEQTWDTIMKGIDDTNKLRSEIESKNVEDRKRLDALNEKYLSQISGYREEGTVKVMNSQMKRIGTR